VRHAVLCAAVMAAWSGAARCADMPGQIPLIAGLTSTSAVSTQEGDYETLAMIERVTPSGYKLTLSGEAADDSGTVREITVSRNILVEDLQKSRTLRRYFDESDPAEFPGTTCEFSSAMIDELRSGGTTTMNYQDVEPTLLATLVKRTLRGPLTRVGGATVSVPILVNGQMRPLRAWHVAGVLSEGGDGEEFDFFVLDDRDNPMLLRSKGPGFSSSVLKIDYPVAAEAPSSLERSLAIQKRAVVYGIYFKFARADIRSESEPVLKQIAGALRANPDWQLSIVGHTDSVGKDAANLELSRRRAAAVRTALVERYGIAPGRLSSSGSGASQPQEKNDTPQGRARNRRVELIRQ
jgi:outer membrane protein OmpA-like peptidoglycan-associated protein